MQSNFKPIVFALVFAAMFILGGATIYRSVTKPFAERNANATRWPTVEAQITRSEVHTENFSDGDKYAHTFAYNYTVNSKEYTGTNIKLNSRFYWSSSKSSINNKIEKYPSGTTIMVFYNPEQPKESYIEPKLSFINILIKYLPLIFTIPIAILMIFVQVKRTLASFKSEY